MAIQIGELLAWCKLMGVSETHRRRRYLEVVQAMDGVYLDHHAEQAKANTQKPGK